MNTLYPHWLGLTFGFLTRFGLKVQGAVRYQSCENCGRRNVEHETHLDPFSPDWIVWRATSMHVAGCGLPCGNGIGYEKKMEEFSKPAAERMIHDAGKCRMCGVVIQRKTEEA